MVRTERPCHDATARDVPDEDSEPREKEAQDGLAESQVSCREGERVYDWQPKRPGDSRQSGQDETLQRNLESKELLRDQNAAPTMTVRGGCSRCPEATWGGTPPARALARRRPDRERCWTGERQCSAR